MTDTTDIDGDVWVTPRYLAGSASCVDPALKPLFDLGFDRHNDEYANLYVASPDRKIRLGFLPEGEDDGLWRITAYSDPFAAPTWGVCFNDTAPTELVAAFTTALATAYEEGPDAYLHSGAHQDRYDALAPLLNEGWKLQYAGYGSALALRSPDGMAGLEYTTGRLDPQRELTTLEARWYMGGGPQGPRWYATASTGTPVPLVTAITTALADPAPVARWDSFLSPFLRPHVQLTPVVPPPPPAPTPLDVRRRTGTRPPALATTSVPRWSTSTSTRLAAVRR